MTLKELSERNNLKIDDLITKKRIIVSHPKNSNPISVLKSALKAHDLTLVEKDTVFRAIPYRAKACNDYTSLQQEVITIVPYYLRYAVGQCFLKEINAGNININGQNTQLKKERIYKFLTLDLIEGINDTSQWEELVRKTCRKLYLIAIRDVRGILEPKLKMGPGMLNYKIRNDEMESLIGFASLMQVFHHVLALTCKPKSFVLNPETGKFYFDSNEVRSGYFNTNIRFSTKSSGFSMNVSHPLVK